MCVCVSLSLSVFLPLPFVSLREWTLGCKWLFALLRTGKWTFGLATRNNLAATPMEKIISYLSQCPFQTTPLPKHSSSCNFRAFNSVREYSARFLHWIQHYNSNSGFKLVSFAAAWSLQMEFSGSVYKACTSSRQVGHCLCCLHNTLLTILLQKALYVQGTREHVFKLCKIADNFTGKNAFAELAFLDNLKRMFEICSKWESDPGWFLDYLLSDSAKGI